MWLFTIGGVIYTHFNFDSYLPILLVIYFTLSYIMEMIEFATEDIKKELEDVIDYTKEEIDKNQIK